MRLTYVTFNNDVSVAYYFLLENPKIAKGLSREEATRKNACWLFQFIKKHNLDWENSWCPFCSSCYTLLLVVAVSDLAVCSVVRQEYLLLCYIFCVNLFVLKFTVLLCVILKWL